jgi:hypothetical protein
MANTYGGLILVGVNDRHEVVGVDERVMEATVNRCVSQLEPPFVPDMALVDGVGPSDLSVLAIRVDPQRSPRPVILDGRVLVRLPGRNALADRARIRDLFTAPTSRPMPGYGGEARPSHWYKPEGMDEQPTFVVRVLARASGTGQSLPPVDTEMRRELRRRLADSELSQWRSNSVDLRDRWDETQWEIGGVNSSVQATMTLDAPPNSPFVPTLSTLIEIPHLFSSKFPTPTGLETGPKA